jgi:prepilin-type N-terminal cleavage/methylation domain-containing protein
MNEATDGSRQTFEGRRAFTLVELLVVIAIILLLTAILVACVNRSIAITRRHVCGHNLKEMGVFWQTYLGDNDERFPQGVDADLWFGGWNSPYAIYKGWPWPRPLNVELEPTDPCGVTKPSAEIFHCPADRGGAPASPAERVYEVNGNSYAANIFLVGQDQVGTGDPRTQKLHKKINLRLKKMSRKKVTNNKDLVILAGDYGWVHQWYPNRALLLGKDVPASEGSVTEEDKRRREWHDKACHYNFLLLGGGVAFLEVEEMSYIVEGKYPIVPFRDP